MTDVVERTDQQSDGHVLRGYFDTVRRRKLVVIGAVLIGLVAGLAYSLPKQKLYESSAQVLLSQQNLAGTLTGAQSPVQNAQTAQRDVETQASVARAPEIAAAVVGAVGDGAGTPREFQSRSRVTVQPNANLLNFYATSPDRTLAPKLANAYAEQYRVYKERLDTAAIERARNGVKAQIREVPRGTQLYRQLVGQDQVLAQMEALQASNAFVVRPAASARQVQPQVLRAVLLGLSAGLVVGLGLAFLVDALDTRVRDEREIVDRLGGVPLLARLGPPATDLVVNDQLVMLAQPHSPAAEGFRVLGTGIEFTRLSHEATVLMVTSAIEQEGKSTTVSNLAVALARGGRNVALVDLDLRRPCIAKFFPGGGSGVTQVAIGEADLDAALVDIDLATPGESSPSAVEGRLAVLPSGPLPPDPGDFVGTAAVARIVEELRKRFDVVLLDAPPSLPVGDPLALSSLVDAIVVVVRLNVTTTKLLDELERQTDQMQAPVIGVVVTDAPESDSYSYYGRSYGPRPGASGAPIPTPTSGVA